MTDLNPTRFFVADEAGASNLVATLLDPANEHEVNQKFRKEFKSLLSIPIGPDTPSRVLREHLAIDLVIWWGDWLILLENKVAAGSVTRGQLTRYYKKTRKLARENEGGTLRTCVLYLTPDGAGVAEFAPLEVDTAAGDVKTHLFWSAVAAAVHRAASGPGEYAAFVKNAADSVKHVIETRRQTKTVVDERRVAMRELIKQVGARIRTLSSLEPDLSLHNWREPDFEELYGGYGKRHINVAVLLDAGSTDAVNPEACTVGGRVYAKVANKAPKGTARRFDAVPVRDWEALVGAARRSPDQPAEQVFSLDAEAREISFTVDFTGTVDDAVELLSSDFCTLLRTVRPLMG